MFGRSRKKTLHLQVDGGPRLEMRPKETVLDAAIRHGIDFPYSCKVGGCASCKCYLVSGQVREMTDKSYVLSREDIQKSVILGCQSVPKTDVHVQLDPAARQAAQGQITAVRKLTHNIAEVFVSLSDAMRYRPGQYTRLELTSRPEVASRCYSFAHACSEEGARRVSFIVREMPGGQMSTRLVHDDSVGQAVTLRGALGDFHLRPGKRPILAIAGGSGLGPILAMLEGALRTPDAVRDVTLLMGARRATDLYYLDEIAQLQTSWPGKFTFTPVLSDEPPDSAWTGAKGWVTEAIDAQNATGAEGYLCGPPPMVEAAVSRMADFGVALDAIYFDKFSDQSTAPADEPHQFSAHR